MPGPVCRPERRPGLAAGSHGAAQPTSRVRAGAKQPPCPGLPQSHGSPSPLLSIPMVPCLRVTPSPPPAASHHSTRPRSQEHHSLSTVIVLPALPVLPHAHLSDPRRRPQPGLGTPRVPPLPSLLPALLPDCTLEVIASSSFHAKIIKETMKHSWSQEVPG